MNRNKRCLSITMLALLIVVLIASEPMAATDEPMAVAPSGRFAYAVRNDGVTLATYSLDSVTGLPTPMLSYTLPTQLGNVSTQIDPSGRFLYILGNDGNDNAAPKIFEYSIDQGTNELSPIMYGDYPAIVTWSDPQPAPVGMTIDSSGRFLFVGDRNSATAYSLAIDPSGILTVPESGSQFPLGANPVALASDPTGRFLYIGVASPTPSILVMQIATNGSLVALAPMTFNLPDSANPVALQIDKTGRFLIVADNMNGVLYTLQIDRRAGALADTGHSVTLNATPLSMLFDPSNRFVYVRTQRDSGNFIATYAFDSNTGALTPASTPFTTSATNQIVINGKIQ